MAYDEYLADRIRQCASHLKVAFEEKKMMGGLAFMLHNKMCIGIVKDRLMARIGPDYYERALQQKGVFEMDFTGRPMKGYVFVAPEALDDEDSLTFWMEKSIAFNKTLV